MANLWTLPLSSSQCHFSVACCTVKWRVSPNPLIILEQGRRSPTKSSGKCDMHPEHRLSIPTSPESVSHCGIVLAPGRVSTALAVSTEERASIFAADIYLCPCLRRWVPLLDLCVVLDQVNVDQYSLSIMISI